MPNWFPVFPPKQAMGDCRDGFYGHLHFGIFAIVASAFSGSDTREFYWRDHHWGFVYLVGFSLLFCGQCDWVGVVDLVSKKDHESCELSRLREFSTVAF